MEQLCQLKMLKAEGTKLKVEGTKLRWKAEGEIQNATVCL